MAFLGSGGDTATTVLELAGLGDYVAGQKLIARHWRDASKAQDEYGASAARASNAATVLAVGGGALATSAALIGKSFLDSAGDLQAIEKGFTTMLGSSDKAKAKIAELQNFAAATPFDFKESAKGAQQLLAMGESADRLIPTMLSVAKATVAAGKGTDDFLGVLRAWGQIRTKGRVQTEEILQMAERGVPAMQILQKELGLTADQIQNLGNQNISADVALAALSRGIDKRFGDALETTSDSFNTAASNFGDAIEQFKQVSGEAILPDATKAITDLTTLVGLARDFSKEHPNIVRFALAFATFGGAVGIVASFLLKLRANALLAAAAKKVLTAETVKDTVAEKVKAGVAGEEGAGIKGVGEEATKTAAKIGALARVKSFLSSPLTLAGSNFQVPAALRGAFGGRFAAGGTWGATGGAQSIGAITTGGALLSGALGIGAGVGARNDYKALGYSDGKALAAGAFTGVAAAATAMFVPGGVVAVALGLGIRALVTKLYSEPIERATSRGTGLDPDTEKKLPKMTNREKQTEYNKLAADAFARGDTTSAESFRYEAIKFGKMAVADERPKVVTPEAPRSPKHLPGVGAGNASAPAYRFQTPERETQGETNLRVLMPEARNQIANQNEEQARAEYQRRAANFERGGYQTEAEREAARRAFAEKFGRELPDDGANRPTPVFNPNQQTSAPNYPNDRRDLRPINYAPPTVNVAPRIVLSFPEGYGKNRTGERPTPTDDPRQKIERFVIDQRDQRATSPDFLAAFRSYRADQARSGAGATNPYDDGVDRARRRSMAERGDFASAPANRTLSDRAGGLRAAGGASGASGSYSVADRRDGTRRVILEIPRDPNYDLNERLRRHNTTKTTFGD